MKPTMFFLMNSIDLARGGLTRASLKQASTFAGMGYKTYMLTFNFNPRYPIIRNKLVKMNKIHKDVIIRNMYEELGGHSNPLALHSPSKKASLTELSRGHALDKREGHNAYRVYENGMYTKYISLNDDDSLNFIDYFNESRYRTKRETYDLWGNLKKIAYMDYSLNAPRQLIYYNNKGKAFLAQWNNPNNDKVQRILLFDDNLSITDTYVNDDTSHKVKWLKYIIDNFGGEKSVVVSDTRSTDDVLAKFSHPDAAKIWRLHSSHLKKPYTFDAEIATKVKLGFENMDKFDAAVFLTEEQKNDVIQRVGEKSNFKVIPHYHEYSAKPFQQTIKSIMSTTTRNEKLGVIVSRLSTLKQINHVVEAFGMVVDKIPDAKLEIWGTGDQESNLKDLINKMKLKENIFLKGYTHYPDQIYKQGLFSILTSKSEGFALSVLESMYNKTPVISYKTKYGPTDMIVDKENGFLIEKNNIEELANKMIYMFEHPEDAKKMGIKAKKYIDTYFNKDIYIQKWLEVVDEVMVKKFNG